MPRIKRLPDALANLIAAGEVVERPGSVVKELVENAVDAGAARITVEIKNGGVSYMRVTDDGCGIEAEDLQTAFLRHATSKIHSESDLNSILTLGFRGEALAAVAAVARVDMFTRTRRSDFGAQITLEGGAQTAFGETGCPVGTTIVVSDLFYNVPARAKFLKKDSAEAAYVESVVAQAAISRPGISFRLIKDGRESLFTQGDGKMLSAIYSVCGRELASGLLQTAGQFGNISVDGFITPPSESRANRAMQYFFVNGRPVRSRALGAALEQAYKTRLPGSRYPACFLNIKLHPTTVDANVHPAKLEVKFSHERDVFSAVYHGVQTALEGCDNLLAPRGAKRAGEDNVTSNQQRITVTRTDGVLTYNDGLSAIYHKAASAPIDYQTKQTAPQPDLPREAKPSARLEARAASEYLVPSIKPAAATATPKADTVNVKIVGEAFSTYIIVQDEAGMWLIDKHAAHERMIYNRLLESADNIASQTLIEPVVATLSAPEKAVCLENIEQIARAGFEIEDFGAGALIVRQIPTYLDARDVPFVLSHFAEQAASAPSGINPVLHGIFCQIACKSAVRAGDFTSNTELERFARQVLETESIRNCPHGRPALVRITKLELEKMFARAGL